MQASGHKKAGRPNSLPGNYELRITNYVFLVTSYVSRVTRHVSEPYAACNITSLPGPDSLAARRARSARAISCGSQVPSPGLLTGSQ